jgi:hypothetical protein
VNVDDYPLAAHMLTFDAIADNNHVNLKWSVNEDHGVYSYVVERSQDNATWSAIYTIQAGGTPGTYHYNRTDDSPLKGESYYRLRIIEATGMNRFSAVRKVKLESQGMLLKLSPNPAIRHTTLSLETLAAGDISVQVVNMQGRTVVNNNYQVHAGMNKIELALPASVSSGSYIVRIVMGEQLVQEKLIVK